MDEIFSTSLRAATAADLPTLRCFKQALVPAERPFDPTLKRGALHYYDLDELLTSPDTCLLVAEAAGRVIGCGYARLIPAEAFVQHAHYAHLGFRYVLPTCRGRGGATPGSSRPRSSGPPRTGHRAALEGVRAERFGPARL